MSIKFTSCAIGLGLIAAFASQASAASGTIIDGTPYVAASIKAVLQMPNGDKLEKVTFTSKDLLAMVDAPKGSKLTTEIYGFGDIYDLDEYFTVIAKTGDYLQLNGNNTDVWAGFYVDDYDYAYFTEKSSKEKGNFAYKTDAYVGFYVGQYTSTGYDEFGFETKYTEKKGEEAPTGKLEQKTVYGKNHETFTLSVSAEDKDMDLDYGRSYDSETDSYEDTVVDGQGSVSIGGSVKLPNL
jgi:hypothetical protein